MQASPELSNPRLSYEGGFAPTVEGLETTARKIHLSSYKIADIVIAVVSLLGAFLLTNLGALTQHGASFLRLRVSTNNLLLIVSFALAWSASFQAFGLYRHQNRRLNLETIARVLAASAAGASFAILFVVTSRAGGFGHGTTLVFWLLAACLAVAVRVILNLLRVPANPSEFFCQ
jgi:FlaA1/EpsC-like NDP-sugar epimerase